MKQELKTFLGAKEAIKKINQYETILFWFRILVFPISMVLICSAFGGQVLSNRPNIPKFVFELAYVLVLLGAIYWASKNFKNFKNNKNSAIINFEIKNQIDEIAPLSANEDLKINGNDKFWNEFKKQQIKIKIPKPFFLDFINSNDAKKMGVLLASVFVFIFYFSNAFGFLTWNFSNSSQISQNIQVFAQPPEFLKSPKIEIENAKQNLIPQNSKITIKIYSDKARPIIKFNGKIIELKQSDSQNYYGEFVSINDGKIKIKLGSETISYKIKIIKDAPLKFLSNVKTFPIGDDRFMMQFNSKEDFGIKQAIIELKGQAENFDQQVKIDEEFPIDINNFNNQGQNSLTFNSAKSALVGSRVIARLKITDLSGNISYSNNFWLNLSLPQLNDDLAQSLQELRLNIIRTTQPYEAYKNALVRIYDENSNQEVQVSSDNYIEHAPKSIKQAYDILQIYEVNYQYLQMDELSHLGLIYAIETLSRARNTQEAKQAGNILWEIIEKYRDAQKDTKTQINDAIENLKQAIKNNASDSEIERLKQELRQAIQNHVEALEQQQQQSGDMEIEDKQSLGDQDIEKAIDDITSKQGDATQKLDELNQFLQNMQLDNNGSASGRMGQETGENQSNDIIDKAQKLYDETQSSNGSNLGELAKEQEKLADDLKSMDENRFSKAINDMERAAQELKQGNKESAQKAQKQAIESLSDALNQSDDNKDPMGRENDNKAKSGRQNPNEKTKIPPLDKEQKSREILQKLKEKANDPKNTPQEQEYFDRLLKNQ